MRERLALVQEYSPEPARPQPYVVLQPPQQPLREPPPLPRPQEWMPQPTLQRVQQREQLGQPQDARPLLRVQARRRHVQQPVLALAQERWLQRQETAPSPNFVRRA